MMLDWRLFFLTSVLFGAVVSLMTCITFCREYMRQTTRWNAFVMALRGGFCAFIFIVGLAAVSGYIKTIVTR